MYTSENLSLEIIAKENLIPISIKRAEVESSNTKQLIEVLNLFKQAKHKAQGKLFLTFDGYNEDKREIYEIKEIRQYVLKAFTKCDCLFYFLTDFQCNNQIILQCLCKYSTVNRIVAINREENFDILHKILNGIIHFSTNVGNTIIDDMDNLIECANTANILKQLGFR